MLTTKEAIEKRRSIRKFKNMDIHEEQIMSLLDAARLAPSGSNSQPWRFKIVKDAETKTALAEAAYRQSFIARAPVVLVCCADIVSYLENTLSGAQDLGKIKAIEDNVVQILQSRVERMQFMELEEIAPRIAFNVAIAMEHIALRALDFGLGSCWIRLIDEEKIKSIFGWSDNIYVVAMLLLGYPDESPAPRKRMKIGELLLD